VYVAGEHGAGVSAFHQDSAVGKLNGLGLRFLTRESRWPKDQALVPGHSRLPVDPHPQ
jgi:hypothetical protein